MTRSIFLLRSLGIFGVDHLDFVLLAALADERPLLLIGPHGTAKSEMLNRIAAELRLRHRHYNASLLSFDDLLGYPVVDSANKRLEFVETEASVWGAESLFFDEISRCRPETANKLFSLIHERRLQGIALTQLRYRWSAMNPPLSEETIDADQELYQGSLPLDPALADRFAWVVTVPDITEMSAEERRSVVAFGGKEGDKNFVLSDLVEQTKRRFNNLSDEDFAWAVEWVEGLIGSVRKNGTISFSGRRCIMLRDSVLWIHAASTVLKRGLPLHTAAFHALVNGIPQRAQGKKISPHFLTGLHRAACTIANSDKNSLLRVILSEPHPVKRIARALRAEHAAITPSQRSEIVSDSLSELRTPERWVLALLLVDMPGIQQLNAPTLEMISMPISALHRFVSQKKRNITRSRVFASQWNAVLSTVSGLEKSGTKEETTLANMLLVIFAEHKHTRFDPDELVEKFYQWRTILFEKEKEEVYASNT